MAEVIFCVDFTLLMRVRRALRLGTTTPRPRSGLGPRSGPRRRTSALWVMASAACSLHPHPARYACRPLPRGGRGVLSDGPTSRECLDESVEEPGQLLFGLR